MSARWLAVIAVAVTSFALKAAGPVLLTNRRVPERAQAILSLLAPALLSALVVIDVAGPHWTGVHWPAIAGLALAATARVLRAPPLICVAAAMATTAGLQLIT